MDDITDEDIVPVIDNHIRKKALDDFCKSDTYVFMLSKIFTYLKYFHTALENIIRDKYAKKNSNFGACTISYTFEYSKSIPYEFSVSIDTISIRVSKKDMVNYFKEALTNPEKIAIYLFLQQIKFKEDIADVNAKICIEDFTNVLDDIKENKDIKFTYRDKDIKFTYKDKDELSNKFDTTIGHETICIDIFNESKKQKKHK
uniref:Uncharacterized protein n=1 Tax=viral metagenome TaxID=1070528 RepID=A0A6C0EBB1_9ZZZZ